MNLSTQPYKGARDFYPEDKRLQKYLFGVMRHVVEKYGYEEYDASLIEPLDIYLAKTGEEIVNEQVYSFKDRGDRQVALRPEMTPTVSRMVAAKRQELSYPLRWYSIPNLWRYERPQRGRTREHWQLNVDLFGLEGIEAEKEIIVIADHLMQAYGAKPNMYEIKVNSRQLLDNFLRDYLKLDDTQVHTLTKLVDRMHKMEKTNFVGQVSGIFSPSQREAGGHEKLMMYLEAQDLSELPEIAQKYPGFTQLHSLIHLLKASRLTNVRFDASVIRGLDYYTDIVFEIFDTHPDNNRSMFGGGRYDGLVSLFGVEALPVVGFGMGDVTLANFLELHNLKPNIKAETDIYAIVLEGAEVPAEKIVYELREMGVNVAVDSTNRKMDSRIKTADKKAIPYVLFIGPEEIKNEQFKLKNLATGDEESLSLQRIVSSVKDHRNT